MTTEPEFPYIPDWQAKVSVEPRISKVQFGDGYVQRLGNGINTMLEKISLTFSNRTDAEAMAIIEFFEMKGGVTPFTAQIGFASKIKKYVTEGEWSRDMVHFNQNTITVTFQEVP